MPLFRRTPRLLPALALAAAAGAGEGPAWADESGSAMPAATLTIPASPTSGAAKVSMAEISIAQALPADLGAGLDAAPPRPPRRAAMPPPVSVPEIQPAVSAAPLVTPAESASVETVEVPAPETEPGAAEQTAGTQRRAPLPMAAVPLGLRDGGAGRFQAGETASRPPDTASEAVLPGDDVSLLGDGLSDYVEAPTDPNLAEPVSRESGAAAASGTGGPRSLSSIDVEVLDPLPPILADIGSADTTIGRPARPAISATPSQALAALSESEGVPDEEDGRRPALSPGLAPAPGEATPPRRSLRGVLEDTLDPDAVVASVNGDQILWRSVLRSAEALPEDYRDRLESVFPALLQRLIDLKLLAQAARQAGFESRPEIRSRVQDYEDALLREALLRDLLEAEVSDAMLQEAYVIYQDDSRARMQVKARHILLETEAAARAVIAELDAGADFDRLARERSLGSSAARGGDLGTVDIGRMVPRFGAALSTLPVGRYGSEPVETEFGWHVIFIEDRQGQGIASLEEIEPQLKRALARTAIEQRLNALRGQAEIDIVQPGAPAQPETDAATAGAGAEQ